MAKKKTLFIVVSIVAAVFWLSFILVIVYFPSIMNVLTAGEENLPQPEITCSEFPIRLEYVVNGKTNVIEDVLVCKLERTEKTTWLEKVNTGVSFKRIWNRELKYHKEGIVLFCDDALTIDFSLGSADYYMGDININTTYPCFRVFKNQENEQVLQKFLFSAEELKNYGIEVVDSILPEPIMNSFS